MWVGLAEPGEQWEPGKASGDSVLEFGRLLCVCGGLRMLLGGTLHDAAGFS